MHLLDLLMINGLDLNSRVKFVRHKQDDVVDMEELIRVGQFESYQSAQRNPVFSQCDYIVSFIGLPGTKARFHGVFKINKIRSVKKSDKPKGALLPNIYKITNTFYEMEQVDGFDDLKDRLVIDWGRGITWHQWAINKTIIELLPVGYVKNFPGLLDFTLWFDELQKIINIPDSNREWYRNLSSVFGVYMILDTNTGLQYVGSASGQNGIIGRWSDYARNGHGGNAALENLLNNNENYARHFKFSLLQALDKTLTRNEVITKEKIWKDKLGSHVFGLNNN